VLELVPRYPYPNLQCPYCEHLNYDNVAGDAENGRRTQQYCANCGADLKKACLVCSYPLYILDNFCGRCRSDQEQAEYQLEAVYWQRFNEGKRLAQAKRWEDAYQELSLFFGTDREVADIGYNIKQVREARQLYRTSIANHDKGVGLQLYNDSREQLRRVAQAHKRAAQARRFIKYAAVAVGLLMMGTWSAFNLGAWWSIFVLVPAVVLILGFLVILMLIHFGVGFN
jgi:hypothetical protein